MNLVQILLLVTTGIFGISFFGFLACWIWSSKWQRAARYFLDLGFLVLCSVLFLEAIDLGVYLPVANTHQVLVFFSWSILLMFMFTRRGRAQHGFGIVLIPLVSIFLLLAIARYDEQIRVPEEYLNNKIFAIHTLAAFFGYAAFALSFVASSLYLLQDRALKRKWGGNFYRQLPSLEALEHMVYVTVTLGVPLIGVTLLTGLVWAKQTFGHYWVWDVKVLLAIATWLLYVYILYLRFVRSFRGLRIMLQTFASFFFLLITFVGTRVFMLKSLIHVS